MNKFRLIIYLLLFYAPLSLSAQSLFSQRPRPAFKNFTIDDGLPSSEVYDVLQDQAGYLWFGTDRGIAKFDGYEFKIFTTKDGLNGNVIFELYEDYKGRIWYLPYNGGIGYIEKNTIKSYAPIDSLAHHSTSVLNSFFIDSLDNVFIGTNTDGIIQISKDGQVKVDTFQSNKASFVEYNKQLYSYSYRTNTEPPDLFYKNLLLKEKLLPGKRTKAAYLSKNLLSFNGNQTLFLYDLSQEKTIQQISFKERITSFQVIDNKLFVGLELKGMHIYEIKNNDFVLLHQLGNNITYSNVEKDHQGGFWFTTIEHGIFYTPNLEVLSYSKEMGMERQYVKELGQYQDQLSIGYGNSFQLLIEEVLSPPQSFINTDSFPINKYFTFHDSIIHYQKVKLFDLKTGFRYPNQFGNPTLALEFIDNDLCLFTKTKGFRKTAAGIVEIDLHRKFSYLEAVAFIDQHHLWIGSTKGLFKRTPSELIDMSTVDPLFSTRIRRIASTQNYGLVLATQNEGILFYKDQKVTAINTQNSLLRTNNIVSLYIDNVENIWAATSKGLYKIDAYDSSKMEYYSKNDGLISDEIVDVQQIKDKLYVGTKEGLSVIDQNTFQKDTSQIHLKITKIKINDQLIAYQPSVDIYPDDKYIEINYLNFSYNSLANIDYKYRIIGYSDKWQYTKNRSINIPIPANYGVYTLELYAKKTSSKHWTKKPATLQITFHPPFYKTCTFIATNLSLIAFIIYLGFKFNLLSYNKYIQQEIISRLLKKLSVKSYLIIEINKEAIRINTDDILYIQSFKDYVEINTHPKKYLYRSTLKKMQEKLSDLHFIRVHRSYIVRKDKIDSISSKQVVVQQQIIPIGKTYVSSIKNFGNHFDALNK